MPSFVINILIFVGSSSEDDEVSPRENIQKNSKGFTEFCVRRIAQVILLSYLGASYIAI